MAVRRKRRVVLLAEDDVLVRNLVRHTLEQAGFLVLAAADGLEALALSRARRERIDVLLTDLDMPRMNGVVLAEHMRRERPETWVLVMSGGTSAVIGVQNLGFAFLPKPFPADVLIRRIEDLIEGKPQPERSTEI